MNSLEEAERRTVEAAAVAQEAQITSDVAKEHKSELQREVKARSARDRVLAIQAGAKKVLEHASYPKSFSVAVPSVDGERWISRSSLYSGPSITGIKRDLKGMIRARDAADERERTSVFRHPH